MLETQSVTIDLDVPEGVRIRGYERKDSSHVFEVDWDLPDQLCCSKCKQTSDLALRFKNEVLAIRDLDIVGQPSFWVYQPMLHQCPYCRQRTPLHPEFKRPNVTYTYRFEQAVLEALVGSSIEETARRMAISAETVERILEWHIADERPIDPNRVIRDIGLDELSLKKRHRLYVTLMTDLTDPENPRILAVVEGRNRAAADACLQRLTPQQRRQVRTHRTDMGASYAAACKDLLPKSQLVIDRFHVAKLLGEAVDKGRKKPGNTSSHYTASSGNSSGH
jgi:transposase